MSKQCERQIKKALLLLSLFLVGGQSAIAQDKSDIEKAAVKLSGKVDVLVNSCGEAGIGMSSKKFPAKVERIGPNSPAYYAGIAKNDKILSATIDDRTKPVCFSLEIERRGKRYSATFEEVPKYDRRNKDNNPSFPGIPGIPDWIKGFNPRIPSAAEQQNRRNRLPIGDEPIAFGNGPNQPVTSSGNPNRRPSIGNEPISFGGVPNQPVTPGQKNGKRPPLGDEPISFGGVPNQPITPGQQKKRKTPLGDEPISFGGVPNEPVYNPNEGVTTVHISQPRTQDLSEPGTDQNRKKRIRPGDEPITFGGPPNEPVTGRKHPGEPVTNVGFPGAPVQMES